MRAINSAKEAEGYTCYLLSFLSKVLKAIVPLRQALVYTNPWWNKRVVSIVKEA